ncbi:MAG TPA: flavodoxin domain-containing protein [Candidatus Limnocylindrales bacterium]|nr:flavodoxin domain-containing protein [Candidatus Limnocylindrales bacterium]
MSGRALVAYATKHGTTGEIARVVAERLVERGLDVDVLPARDVRDVTPYRVVVLGSAVYMNRWQGDGLDFLKRFEHDLADRPVWLFSSGPTGGTPDADAAVARTLEAQPPAPGEASRLGYRIGVRGHATFGGRIVESMGGIFERWMPRGDWRDPAAIVAWADLIAAEALATAG